MKRNNYEIIDKSPLVNFIFYPRNDYVAGPDNSFDYFVKVSDNTQIHCRFYHCGLIGNPWILYFHGNGEVVSDYNEIATYYNNEKLNLIVADYRGYGKSTGNPTLNSMVKDSGEILRSVLNYLIEENINDKIFLMGRSLGSIPAIELAVNFPDKIYGLIIESGFISTARLIKHLRLPAFGLDLKILEEESVNKVRKIKTPSLVIHGKLDNLIPFSEGEDLFKSIGSKNKDFISIQNANHNDIMFAGKSQYFDTIKLFVTNNFKSDG